MTKQQVHTVPAHSWLLDSQEHKPRSEIEALMMDQETNWSERDESLLDLVDDTLTDEEVEVVNLKVFDNRSFRFIAARMGWSVGKAHGVYHRAIEKMRKAIENENTEDHS